MITEKISTMLLVKMIGMFPKIMPYTSHIITDMVAKVNMSKEMSAADFVFHVLTTWGRKVIPEIQPAISPSISIGVML